MSVSGEKAARPKARKPVQPVKKPVKPEHHQPASSYEDLLGLVSVTNFGHKIKDTFRAKTHSILPLTGHPYLFAIATVE